MGRERHEEGWVVEERGRGERIEKKRLGKDRGSESSIRRTEKNGQEIWTRLLVGKVFIVTNREQSKRVL